MPDGAPRIIQAPPVTIISATDLGNVEVAKEGNLYLLTDPRGDIRSGRSRARPVSTSTRGSCRPPSCGSTGPS